MIFTLMVYLFSEERRRKDEIANWFNFNLQVKDVNI